MLGLHKAFTRSGRTHHLYSCSVTTAFCGWSDLAFRGHLANKTNITFFLPTQPEVELASRFSLTRSLFSAKAPFIHTLFLHQDAAWTVP